jgi:hypothetical protein
MNIKDNNTIQATGGCLCGAVRYEIHGELLSVLNCHCSKCRRFNGHIGAYTATHRDNLIMTRNDGLKWYQSILDETPNVYRGFCKECGSSLFWDPRESDNISITAGSIDEPTNLKTTDHVWVSQKADYYKIDDDLPQHKERYDRNQQ